VGGQFGSGIGSVSGPFLVPLEGRAAPGDRIAAGAAGFAAAFRSGPPASVASRGRRLAFVLAAGGRGSRLVAGQAQRLLFAVGFSERPLLVAGWWGCALPFRRLGVASFRSVAGICIGLCLSGR